MSEDAIRKVSSYAYMQNRELSWLEFNKRVLDQGADPAVPLLERLGFLSIYWSNLREFFMIRVGSLTDLSLVKKTILDSKSGMTPSQQLDAIYKRCHELSPYYESTYKALRKELAAEGIYNTRGKNLTEEQKEFVSAYFDANIMPFLSPQIVNARHPFPHLENGALYVVVRLDEEANKESKKKSKSEKAAKSDKATSSKDGKDKGKGKDAKGKGGKGKDAKNMGAEGVTLGIIPLPRQCSRIVRLPGEGIQFVLLEHVIEMFVQNVFSMYKVKHTNIICVTRNADLDATEGTEEQGEDYREHIKRILKKRTRLMPVRLESERELSATVKPVLLERLNLKSHQTFVTAVPLDLGYVYELAPMLDEKTRAKLTTAPFTPQWPATLDPARSIIEQVCEKEVLLSYPYETMDAFVQLLREAASDPEVVSIRITLYRLAKQSHLAEALIAAAENGKEVTALFELRARFDESNNIEWSQRFEQAGCRVIYGFRDYKVHSKICCITRQSPRGLQIITQLGTGNYNEKTARLYTDFSFITTNPEIGRDAVVFFRNMTLENLSDEYRTLWVAPLQIKQNILAGIDEQIANKKAGKPAGVFFKTNSITDKEIIEKIVEASQAGVQCTLLVRGISCIVPGVPGYTENVCVVSIVGRLLEHSRIYLFGPFDGDFKLYLSSADLMTRNMDKRIEVAWPVVNHQIREQILGYIGTCMADTAKLRDLLPTKKYTELGFFAKADKDDGQIRLFDSQNYLIFEAKRKRLEADEEIAAAQDGGLSAIRNLAQDELDIGRLGEETAEFEELAAKAEHAWQEAMEDAPETDPEVVTGAVVEAAAEAASSASEAGLAPDEAVYGGESTDAAPAIEDASFAFDETDASGLPSIEGLYQPEPNADGKFTIPTADGEIEIERIGGPVPDEQPEADLQEEPSQEAGMHGADVTQEVDFVEGTDIIDDSTVQHDELSEDSSDADGRKSILGYGIADIAQSAADFALEGYASDVDDVDDAEDLDEPEGVDGMDDAEELDEPEGVDGMDDAEELDEPEGIDDSSFEIANEVSEETSEASSDGGSEASEAALEEAAGDAIDKGKDFFAMKTEEESQINLPEKKPSFLRKIFGD